MPSIYRCLCLAVLLVGMSAPAVAFVWPRATAAEVDIDPDMIQDLVGRIQAGDYGDLKSLVIVRHGRLVHEQYFNGQLPHEVMPLYSVTKSWGSALMGVAMHRGDLGGVETPLMDLFPGYADVFNASSRKRKMTVRDLLTMRHGLQWDEWSTFFSDPSNPAWQMTQAPDWWRNVLENRATARPDSVFRYSTGMSNLMGGILWNELGMSGIDYAREHLFPVLDIRDWHIEVDMTGNRTRGSGIRQFQPGLTPTGHGLWLTALDLAKIGQLYLDRGVFQARRLLDSAWVEESWGAYSNQATDPQVFGAGISYGYQWWTLHLSELGGGPDVHFANGFGDQFIYVVPALDLVVVATADNGGRDGPTTLTAMREVILPGVAEDFDPAADGGLTGSWYAPELDAQGFMLEVVPSTGQVVIYWMTYDPLSDEQMWLFAVGQLHGRRAVLEFLRPEGGTFAGGDAASKDRWGDVELVFEDCTHASLHFFSAIAGVEGLMELRRLTPNVSCRDD